MTRKLSELNIFPFAAPNLPEIELGSRFNAPDTLISVILPTYNHGRFLSQSISSVLSQKVSLELIVVDDGSTDDTARILKEYAAEKRVKVISQTNSGLSNALNRGFAEAKGEYLSWTSADNLYLPGALRRLAHFLLHNPSIGLVYANVCLIDQHGLALNNSNYRKEDQDCRDNSILRLPSAVETLASFNDNFINSCFMFRRDLLQRVGAHDPDLLGFEDYDFWLRASLTTRFSHLDSEEPYYQYRLHRGSLTESLGSSALAVSQSPYVVAANYCSKLIDSPLEFSLSHRDLDSNKPIFDLVRHCLNCAGYSLSPQPLLENEHNKGSKQQDIGKPLITLELLGNDKFAGLSKIQPLAENLPGLNRSLKILPQSPDLKLQLAHQSHSRFLVSRQLNSEQTAIPQLDAMALFVFDKGLADSNQSPLTASLVLSPLKLPTVLRRARDGCRGAVSVSADSQSIVLIFTPDYHNDHAGQLLAIAIEKQIASLIDLITALPRQTFVLYCENSCQRQTADRVNLGLCSNNNLRIIDVTEDTGAKDTCLMHALSSSNVVLHLGLFQQQYSSVSTETSDRSLASALLELRIEAAIAAAAGLKIVSLLSKPLGLSTIEQNRQHLDGEFRHSSVLTNPQLIAEEAYRCIRNIPHLETVFLPDFRPSTTGHKPEIDRLAVALSDFNHPLSSGSLEQWLESLSAQCFGRLLCSSLFCPSLKEIASLMNKATISPVNTR